MKALGILGVCLVLVGFVLIGLAVRSSAGQGFSTQEGPLMPGLVDAFPPITRATLIWSDAEAGDLLLDKQTLKRVEDESEQWVRRIFRADVLPSSPKFRAATLDVYKAPGEEATAYDATRAKFRVDGAEVFITQTKGFMSVLYRPEEGLPTARAEGSDLEDLHRYLEGTVFKLFRRAEVMMFLAAEPPIKEAYSLQPDMKRIFLDKEKTLADVGALDPELPWPPIGGIHSYHWGSFYFCTNGREVVATFNKVQGGRVFAIDEPKW